MISPNQIKMQTFTSAGRGAYRAADVDDFMQQIYISYTELLSENASMKKKFASLSSIIDEYNAGKNAIATALVKAQAVADETMRTAKVDAISIVSDAKEEANNILNETQQQAESYAREKKEAADAYFARAEQELQRVMAEAKAQSEKYVAEVNAQASAVIADANAKAAAIVGAAYKDAKIAKEKTAEIIERANVEMETTRNEILSFKESALQQLSALVPLVEGINPDDYTAAELTAETQVPQLQAEEITAPVFSLQGFEQQEAGADVSADEPEADAEDSPVQDPASSENSLDLSETDDVIAKMESFSRDIETQQNVPEQQSLFDLPASYDYAPYIPNNQEPVQQPVVADAEPEAAAQMPFEEILPVEEEPVPVYEEPAPTDTQSAPVFAEPDPVNEDALPVYDAPATVEPAPVSVNEEPEAAVSEDEDDPLSIDFFDAFDFESDDDQTIAGDNEVETGDDDSGDDDDDGDDDEPHDPFKFRLTKNFDIFDDDND